MSGAPTPPVFPEAFAAQADPEFINTIPDTSGDPQRATYELGFPPQTMTPILAGGKPMLGPDMNGILFAISSHTVYQQTGQPYYYNSTVATEIGGYAVGTILGMTSGKGLWMNLVNANSSDPDASGAGWVGIAAYGHFTINTTGGIVTPALVDVSVPVIVISGVLTANLQIVLPAQERSWLIVNTTTGSFTTTVRTAGGAGVAVGQGGYAAPAKVYGNGADIFYEAAPTVIPSAVAPTPNTFAVRDGNGDLFARLFNSNLAASAFAVFNVIADNGDGNLRKIGLANFLAQLTLSGMAGQVTAAQVPVGAVTQYSPDILNNSNLTGTPFAPTPPAGNNSQRIATTAFVAGALSVVGTTINVALPGGFVLKAGFTQGAGAGPGDVIVTFASAFPNSCIAAICSTANRNGAGSNGSNYVRNLTAAGFIMFVDTQQTGPGAGNKGGYWVAVGT